MKPATSRSLFFRAASSATPSLAQQSALARWRRAMLGAGLLIAPALVLAQQSTPTPGQPAGAANYLEVLGGTVPVDAVPQAGALDRNPLLNPGAGASGTPGMAADTAAGPISDGHVSTRTNVPAPASLRGGDAQRLAAAPVASSAGGQGGNGPGSGSSNFMRNQQNSSAQFQTAQGAQGAGQPVPANPSVPGGAMGAVAVDALPNPALGQEADPADLPKEVVKRLSPATAEQLRAIMQEIFQRQGAAVTPQRSGLVGKASQYEVDLSPGAAPPVVRVARGLGATVNFLDSAGNPWPIAFAQNFYAEAGDVTQMAPHVLSVSLNSEHLRGSAGVMLQGLPTPVNFVFVPAQDVNDYRVDLRIPGLAPNAAPVPGAQNGRPDLGASNSLKEFLYGAAPDGATRLKVDGAGASASNTRAWQAANGQLVLRTAGQVISPGWYERMSALDGTTVYALPASPVVRVAVDGRETTFMVDGLQPIKGGTSTLAASALGGVGSKALPKP